MKYSFESKSLEDLDKISEELLKLFPNERIFALHGEMGVGKTTFIKSICKKLGVEDITNSPTFAIINQYTTTDNQDIFHFDLYRLNNEEEVYDIGIEEYITGENYCFFEWPEIAENIIPEDIVYINISEEDEVRRITFED